MPCRIALTATHNHGVSMHTDTHGIIEIVNLHAKSGLQMRDDITDRLSMPKNGVASRSARIRILCTLRCSMHYRLLGSRLADQP